nr:MAG TPA: hypothetical protein [Caudoviricetes sp.]
MIRTPKQVFLFFLFLIGGVFHFLFFEITFHFLFPISE